MDKDFFELVNDHESDACKASRLGVLITSGAIGDCILALPLVDFVKNKLGLGGIDIIGRSEYIDFYPSRSCVRGIRSIESIAFNRMFCDWRNFELEEKDVLISAFEGYEQIVSFMGYDNSDFEQNLIYTVNCSHAADIRMLGFSAATEFKGHISEFYIREFARKADIEVSGELFDPCKVFITPLDSDVEMGRELLRSYGLDLSKKIVAIHPGSGGLKKCWHVKNFFNVAKKVKSTGAEVVLMLGPAELDRAGEEMTAKLNGVGLCVSGLGLGEILQILSCVDVYLGNDSGITHMSSAMGTETIAIFGASNEVLFRPIGPKVKLYVAERESFEQPCEKDSEQVSELVGQALDN